MISSTDVQIPITGRLMRRALSDGSVWGGLLKLPSRFVPAEGVAYTMSVESSSIRVFSHALDEGLASHSSTEGRCLGIGDILTRPIWNKTADASLIPVRFLSAFPEDNRWTVYGPSLFPVASSEPVHQWWDVEEGRLSVIAPPMDAKGKGFSQIFSVDPVWPGPNGDMYVLPTNATEWRPYFHAYHELLAHASRTQTEEGLSQSLKSNPRFLQISSGQPDSDFCAYLAYLQDEGLLCVEKPQSVKDVASRAAVCDTFFAQLFHEKYLSVSHARFKR